jgi:hypothetical protein
MFPRKIVNFVFEACRRRTFHVLNLLADDVHVPNLLADGVLVMCLIIELATAEERRINQLWQNLERQKFVKISA